MKKKKNSRTNKKEPRKASALKIALCAIGAVALSVAVYFIMRKPDTDASMPLLDAYAYVYAENNNSPIRNLRARSGDTIVFLEWDDVFSIDGNPVDGYVISRYNENTKDFFQWRGTSENNIVVFYLTNNEEYRFKVAAKYVVDGNEVLSAFTDVIAITPRFSARVKPNTDFLLLKTGEQKEVFATQYGNRVHVTWNSTDKSVAAVDGDGVVEALGPGYCEIIGTAGNNTITVAVLVDRQPNWTQSDKVPRYAYDAMTGWYKHTALSEEGEKKLVRLSFVGDLMCTWMQQDAAKTRQGGYDFTRSFSKVREILNQSDFVMGNLETTISYSFPYSIELHNNMGSEHYNAPGEFLYALSQTGFDAVTTANNHCTDSGPNGIIETLDALEHYGIIATGTFGDQNSRRYELVDVMGIKCGIIAVNQKVAYGSQATLFEAAQLSSMINQAQRDNTRRYIENARNDGAEFIIVFNHGGYVGNVTQTDVQLVWNKFLADAGADLIVNAHPHVLQKVDTIATTDGRKVLVAYSLGNFASSMTNFDNSATIIFNVMLTRENGKATIADYDYIPCYIFKEVVRDKYVVVPATPENKDIFGNMLYDRAIDYIARAVSINKLKGMKTIQQ